MTEGEKEEEEEKRRRKKEVNFPLKIILIRTMSTALSL